MEERFCSRDETHKQTCGIRYLCTSDVTQWQKGSDKSVVLTVKNVAPGGEDSTTFSRFKAVYANGKKLVDGKDFTKKPGSIIITLQPAYLNQLAGGRYSFSVELNLSSGTDDSTSSDAEGETLLVTVPCNTAIQIVEPSGVPSPNTGESSALPPICTALLLLASFGVLVSFKRGQETQPEDSR